MVLRRELEEQVRELQKMQTAERCSFPTKIAIAEEIRLLVETIKNLPGEA